jgi:uncharacterized membrane protein
LTAPDALRLSQPERLAISHPMSALNQPELIKASCTQATINTVINGVINYFMIRGNALHTITADSITSGGSDTVIGHSVFTAMILAVIFTLMGFKSHRSHLRGVTWGDARSLAAKNAVFAFGIIIIGGVLWQKVCPGVTVGTLTAAAIAGAIAGLVSGITNYSTLSRLRERSKS